MANRVLSLAEITELERARLLGAPVFRTVLEALVARHRLGLRDAETATRLLFYIHEGNTTQPQYIGMPYEDLPDAGTVLRQVGGEAALPADALFALGLLLDGSPWSFGDEATWGAVARRWLELATVREPGSRLFREWPFFAGDATDTGGPKIYIAPEIHARYHGRGAFGDRMLHLLYADALAGSAVRWLPGIQQPRAVTSGRWARAPGRHGRRRRSWPIHPEAPR